jgi:acetyl esterase/lipase
VPSILERAAPSAGERLAYGKDDNHFGDLFLPKSQPPKTSPLVIMIHGGFWRAKYDLTHAGHLCAALAASGIAAWNVEYRRVGNPGGGWPGSFDDIRCAYRYIRENAAKYGVDAARLGVMGHSAGGQLALSLAAREPQLKATISLAGVVDLRRAYERHLSNDAALEFMGGTPEQKPGAFREANPMQFEIPHVAQFLIHGSGDDTVSVEFSRDYVRAKEKRGEDVHLLEVKGADHFDLIDPESRAWTAVLALIKSAVGA